MFNIKFSFLNIREILQFYRTTKVADWHLEPEIVSIAFTM